MYLYLYQHCKYSISPHSLEITHSFFPCTSFSHFLLSHICIYIILLTSTAFHHMTGLGDRPFHFSILNFFLIIFPLIYSISPHGLVRISAFPFFYSTFLSHQFSPICKFLDSYIPCKYSIFTLLMLRCVFMGVLFMCVCVCVCVGGGTGVCFIHCVCVKMIVDCALRYDPEL